MIRRTFWQGLLGCAVAALLAGCGSDNATIPTAPSNVTSQFVTKAAGAPTGIKIGASTVTIPANALSQDAIVTVTDSPATLTTAEKTSGLIGSTTIAAASGTTLASGSTLTLTVPSNNGDSTTPVAVVAYRLDGGSPVEVDAVVATGSTAAVTLPAFGTYGIYNTARGASPSFPLTTQQDGLVYVDTAVGTGATAAVGSNVSVRYIGAYTSGSVFDSNTGTGKSLLTATLGTTSLITGFTEGIEGMKVGGRRRLYIPSALGYGTAGKDPIPPDTDLVFDVQLVSVN